MYPYQYGFQQSRQEIIRVNGENGARAFQLPPNSSALLLDETNPIVWLAQTDGAGYKQLTAYKIEPYTPARPEDLEARIKRLEELFNESNAKSVKPAESTSDIIVS